LSRIESLKLETSWWIRFLQTCSFSLHTTHLLTDLSRVDYCDVFSSCFDTHSDGTHSLQRIHCWASDIILNFSRSVLMKKQTHLHLESVNFKHIFIFFWSVFFFGTVPLSNVNKLNHTVKSCQIKNKSIINATEMCPWNVYVFCMLCIVQVSVNSTGFLSKLSYILLSEASLITSNTHIKNI